MIHEIKAIFKLIKMCKRIMFAMASAYKLLQNENFRTIQFTTAKNLIIQTLSKTTHREFVVRTNK